MQMENNSMETLVAHIFQETMQLTEDKDLNMWLTGDHQITGVVIATMSTQVPLQPIRSQATGQSKEEPKETGELRRNQVLTWVDGTINTQENQFFHLEVLMVQEDILVSA